MNAAAIPAHLEDALASGPDAVRSFVGRAGGTPLQHGHRTTFVFVGRADDVRLRHWMDTFPPLPPFTPDPTGEVWVLSIDLPDLARIEYKLAVRRDGRQRLLLDPLNPQRSHDPVGRNSVATGPGYRRPSWTERRPGVPAGSVTTIAVTSAAFGTRSVSLYRPASPGVHPLPLLVVHDGTDYLRYGGLATVLDNLIAAGTMVPVYAVMSDPANRKVEYAASADHADHVVGEVVPAVAAAVPVDGGRVVALGASLGGVASLHAAWLHPGAFSGLILQSGSVVTALGGPFRRGRIFAPVVRFMDDLTARPGTLPRRIHLSCGRYDGLYADNVVLARRLRRLGVDVEFEEAPDGHSWENWRDRLRSGLVHALSPDHAPG